MDNKPEAEQTNIGGVYLCQADKDGNFDFAGLSKRGTPAIPVTIHDVLDTLARLEALERAKG